MSDTATNKGMDRLAYEYFGSEKFKAFIRAFLQQADDLYDSAVELIVDRTLETAYGVQLDGIGDIVGVKRYPGSDDEKYRWMVRAKILINSADMTAPNILSLLFFIFGGDNPIQYVLGANLWPIYYINREVTPEELYVFGLIPEMLGVTTTYISIPDPDTTFSFAEDPTGEGWGSRGEAWGDELVTNYNFEEELSGWKKSGPGSGTISVIDGELNIDRLSDGGVYAEQLNIDCTPNAAHEVTVRLKGAATLIRIGNGSSQNNAYVDDIKTEAGLYKFRFTPLTSKFNITFLANVPDSTARVGIASASEIFPEDPTAGGNWAYMVYGKGGVIEIVSTGPAETAIYIYPGDVLPDDYVIPDNAIMM